MKKRCYLMALAAFALAACSDDTDAFRGEGPTGKPDGRGLSFVFPGTAKGVVPYSAEASASENELKTLDIYVFGEDTTSAASPKPMVLEEVFKSGVSGEFDFTTSGADKLAKISVYAGNKKSFFFVANGREHLSLDSLELHVTDTATFARKATNVQNGLLECPLLMSGFHDMPDVAAAIAGGAIEVELVRRVARFDLLNNSDDSGFIIKEIVVSNARGGIYIFEGNATAYEAPLLTKLPIIDFAPFPNANYGESNSVLYMYPTKIAGETELSLVGVVAGSGAPQVYPVKLKPNQTDADDKLIQIKPNNRYLLSVLSLGTGYINATLKVTEWVVGDTINSQTGYGTIKLSDKDGKALKDSTISVGAEALLTDSVLINVAAASEWELFVDPAYDWISVTPLPGDTVMRSFSVTTTTPNPSSLEARMATVVVRNRQRPSIMQTLLVKQDKNATRYIDLSGKRLQGNVLKISGEIKDSMNVDLSVPAGVAWTATEKSDWFNIGEKAIVSYGAYDGESTQSGTGSGVISIVPEANTTEIARLDTVVLTIAGTEGKPDLVQRLIVSQAPRNLGSIQLRMVGVKDEKITIEASGFNDADKKREVKVIANTDWKVDIPAAASWLTMSDRTITIANTGNGYFKLEAAPNTAAGAVERTAVVTVENTLDANIKKTITITQKAAPAAIVVSATSDVVNLLQDGTGQDVTITVTNDVANAGWEIDGTPEAWITTSILDNTLTISAAANADFTEKTGSVVVKSKTDASKTATIQVTQAAALVTIAQPSDIASITTPETVAITCNDGTNWTVTNNSENDDTSGAPWLTTEADGAGNITVTAEANTSGSVRTATVTVTSTTQAGVSTTFEVSQD